ncbi:MAG: GNAT family N-acetyltransferase [Bacteroidales bacterium]|nr:GNAT family N-acetyltransferase [Bacteroidales bacterium]
MTNDLLTGKKLKLRAVEPSDIDLLLECENNTSIWKVSNTVTPYSRFELEEYVLNAKRDIFSARQLRLMIDRIDGVDPPVTIGTIDLYDFDPVHLRAGIGIMIAEEFREQGHAAEALKILIRYAVDSLLLHQLFCHISSDNQISIRLFESLGFIRCGEKKEWLNIGDGWMDEYMYQLIL